MKHKHPKIIGNPVGGEEVLSKEQITDVITPKISFLHIHFNSIFYLICFRRATILRAIVCRQRINLVRRVWY